MAKLSKIKKKEIQENEIDINIEEFASRLGFEILHRGKSDTIHFSTFNINRPGLQLAGFYEHFVAQRVQIIGEQETAYLNTLESKTRLEVLDRFFAYEFPCLVIAASLEPCKELVECAEKYSRVVLRSRLRTTMTVNELSIFLNEALAPQQTVHGVLVDLYGVGVLIIGNSGIGKSETALELIQRNHRLVADDAVVIKRINDRLLGASPSIIKHFMEVRGIGIIDIRSMYGSGAVKLTKGIDLVIKLEDWDPTKVYNRLGDVKETHNILDVMLPMHTIPVKPGRNLAVILEVAARNYRLKSMGYDALEELNKRVNSKSADEDPFDF